MSETPLRSETAVWLNIQKDPIRDYGYTSVDKLNQWKRKSHRRYNSPTKAHSILLYAFDMSSLSAITPFFPLVFFFHPMEALHNIKGIIDYQTVLDKGTLFFITDPRKKQLNFIRNCFGDKFYNNIKEANLSKIFGAGGIFTVRNEGNMCLIETCGILIVIQNIQHLLAYVRTNNMPIFLKEQGWQTVGSMRFKRDHFMQHILNLMQIKITGTLLHLRWR